jgi:hypothetical protein
MHIKFFCLFLQMNWLWLSKPLAWSSSLIRSHNLSFAEWLKSPLQEKEYKQLAEHCQQLQIDKLPHLDLQPYINLLKVSPEAMDNDYNNLIISSWIQTQLTSWNNNKPFRLKNNSILMDSSPMFLWLIMYIFHIMLCLAWNFGTFKHMLMQDT